MPRNMSFMATTEQVRQQTKDVTRRVGWAFLKPGDLFQPCEKCQGLGKGGKVVKIGGLARVVSTEREPLIKVLARGDDEVRREGFPELTPLGFVDMFCKLNGIGWDTKVTRIVFEYL